MIGKFNVATGFTNDIFGTRNDVRGDQNNIHGNSNIVNGVGNVIIGGDSDINRESNSQRFVGPDIKFSTGFINRE